MRGPRVAALKGAAPLGVSLEARDSCVLRSGGYRGARLGNALEMRLEAPRGPDPGWSEVVWPGRHSEEEPYSERSGWPAPERAARGQGAHACPGHRQ